MSEGKEVVDISKVMFGEDLGTLAGIREKIMKEVQANPTATAQNIGRQTLDHLDAAALFLQNLGMYFMMADKAVEEEVAKQPGLKVVS